MFIYNKLYQFTSLYNSFYLKFLPTFLWFLTVFLLFLLSIIMTYNAVVLSNASGPVIFMNGTYTLSGQENGKNKYTRLILNEIRWSGSAWNIETRPAPGMQPLDVYYSSENVEFPWQVQSWSGSFGTNITLTPTDPIAPTDPISLRNAKYATATESGAVRFRRLVGLGYV